MESPKDMKDMCDNISLEELLEAMRRKRKPVDEQPKQPGNTSAATPQLPDIYYCIGTKEYYVQASDKTWIPVNENSVKRHLKDLGYVHGKEQSGTATPLEKCLNQIQLQHGVSYAAPLAGFSAGFYRINGQNVLVTNSPQFVQAAAGGFPILGQMLERMFVTAAKDQRPYIYGWLKIHLEALRDKRWSYGQALAMCGPVNCGKSLLQRLFTVMFGGRSAKPYQYMTDRTTFNSDLFEAEHLMIEDEAESTQHSERKKFGASIKNVVANSDQRCHGKYSKGLTLTPMWRVSISLNDEPQRLLMLPPIDQDTEDKIILLKVNETTMPMPLETNEERQAFWATLVAELPAFIDFLFKWEIPKELRHSRWGITHYHHPDILAAVDEVSDEIRLLNLIDEEIPFHRGEPWKGTAMQLERELTDDNSSVKLQARKLFYFNRACGSHLAALAKKMPHRVEKLARRTDEREWQISPIPGKIYPGMIHTNGMPHVTN